jgi:hypothetical protein
MTTACMLSWMPRKPKPEDQKKITVSTRIIPSELEQIDALAKADDRNAAYIIAKAIREYLDRQAKPRRK